MAQELAFNRFAAAAPTYGAGRAYLVRLLLIAFILGLPLWWFLGVSFLLPLAFIVVLILIRPSAHRSFTLTDVVLLGIVTVFVMSAYLNGFLTSQQPLRFVAALYNAAFWACGLVLVQQMRCLFRQSDVARRAILKAGYTAYLILAGLSWGSFALAYAVHDFNFIFPSLLGIAIGEHIPESASLIHQSTTMVFTRADWGLPGVPMPRVGIYGPYPNSTAAVMATLGTMGLLHLHERGRHDGIRVVVLEILIAVTLVITLSRSIVGGWAIGVLLANLLFGSTWRRWASGTLIASVLMLPVVSNILELSTYRQYSTESRFANYFRAFDATMRENPVLGLGIKPREEISHIAVGSHSTFVSSFTKGGFLGLSLATLYLVIIPVFQWLKHGISMVGSGAKAKAEMRALFTLQVAVWLWLSFEDLDAPATAAILIFMSFAFMEDMFRRGQTTTTLVSVPRPSR